MGSSQVHRTLARLDAERKKHGIKLGAIAAEATKTAARGSVSVSAVSRVLRGHSKSANVVDTIKRLLAAVAAASSQAEEAR